MRRHPRAVRSAWSAAFFLCLCLSSCGFKAKDESKGTPALRATAEQASPASPAPASSAVAEGGTSTAKSRGEPRETAKATSPKLVRTADVNCRVEDYAKAREAVVRAAESCGGYVAGEKESRTESTLQNHMILRVLSEQFDKFMADLAGIASYTHSKSVDVQDVTAEYVDMEARLAARREVENRYVEILKKAYTIPDVLAVEAQLKQVREEVEAAVGRLRYLSDQVGFSTVRLTMYQSVSPVGDPDAGFFRKLWISSNAGFDTFKNMILNFVYVWPAWLVLGLLGWGVAKVVRKARRSGRPPVS